MVFSFEGKQETWLKCKDGTENHTLYGNATAFNTILALAYKKSHFIFTIPLFLHIRHVKEIDVRSYSS